MIICLIVQILPADQRLRSNKKFEDTGDLRIYSCYNILQNLGMLWLIGQFRLAPLLIKLLCGFILT